MTGPGNITAMYTNDQKVRDYKTGGDYRGGAKLLKKFNHCG